MMYIVLSILHATAGSDHQTLPDANIVSTMFTVSTQPTTGDESASNWPLLISCPIFVGILLIWYKKKSQVDMYKRQKTTENGTVMVDIYNKM